MVGLGVGQRLGKYQILEVLGRGGMGVVYKARDTTLDRLVALKVLSPNLAAEPEFVQRFQLEARAAAKLSHPNIVTIYEIGQEAGWWYIAMAFLPGCTLDRLIQQQGALELRRAVAILAQIAAALQHAHQAGLVHRDVKPGNIMVDGQGHATLLDFGIVRALQESRRLTGWGTNPGTLLYMSPEQVAGQPAMFAADIYALGATLFEMLTGRVPFDASNIPDLMRAIVQDPPPRPSALNPRIPPAVDQVILKALNKDPACRFRSAMELATALYKAAGLTPTPPMERAARAVRKRMPLVVLVVVSALLLSVMVIFVANKGDDHVTPSPTRPSIWTATPSSTRTLTPTPLYTATQPPTFSPVPALEKSSPGVSQPSPTCSYTVQFGDTFYSIARRFGMTPEDLARANAMSEPPKLINVGQSLRVPCITPLPLETPTATHTPTSTSTTMPTGRTEVIIHGLDAQSLRCLTFIFYKDGEVVHRGHAEETIYVAPVTADKVKVEGSADGKCPWESYTLGATGDVHEVVNGQAIFFFQPIRLPTRPS